MKTHSTGPSIVGESEAAASTIRFRAICGAIAFCLTATAPALAQTPGGVGSQVTNGLFTHGDESFRLVDTAGFRTAADVGVNDPSTIERVSHGACSSCGTSCGGACGGGSSFPTMSMSGCNSCGTSSCGGACGSRRTPLTCGNNYMDPCNPCDPYRYGMVEALYMQPDEDSFSLSPNFRMDGFDNEFAGRYTFGMVGDCVHGYEVSFVGPFQWDMAGQAASPGGGINSFLTTGSPATALSSFTDATFQSQRYEAEFMSLEANKTLVGWEMAKLLIGGRYISYDEEFDYFSQTATEAGRLNSNTENQLFGAQVGMDLLFPISRNGFTDTRIRAGGFLNFADSDVRLFNNGDRLVTSIEDDSELAGFFELGTGVRYQLGEILSVRAGVELWYLTGVASAPDQFRNQVGPSTGRPIRVDDDVLFTGISFGAELRY